MAPCINAGAGVTFALADAPDTTIPHPVVLLTVHMRIVHDPPDITVTASTGFSASPSMLMCNPSSTTSFPEIMKQAEEITT